MNMTLFDSHSYSLNQHWNFSANSEEQNLHTKTSCLFAYISGKIFPWTTSWASSNPSKPPPLVIIEHLTRTYRWASPAFLTADEMALIAVSMELISWVSSPVAPLACLPVSITNRVRVHTSVSKADWSDILLVSRLFKQAQTLHKQEMEEDSSPELNFAVWTYAGHG